LATKDTKNAKEVLVLTKVESDLPPETEELISQIIGAAIRVHSELGPGFLESIYASALAIELGLTGIPFERELGITVHYRGHAIAGHRLDFVVADAVVLEIKAAPRIDPIFQAKLLSYLRATKLRAGLLINFNMRLVREGIKRVVV
jgi:GxxExxY protein